jgi:excisionase family DNA binding protein
MANSAKPKSKPEPIELARLMTVQEAAEILRLSVSTLNKWRVAGGGPRFVRMGARVRYRPSDLNKYVDERTKRSTSEP